MNKVSPSILSSDFSKLGEEILRLNKAGADMIHFDVMDGTFVPNITIGSPVVKSLRGISDIPFDVHLMVEHPDSQIESFAKAGADIISFHIEATNKAKEIIDDIKSYGVKACIAINPPTDIKEIEPLLPYVDMVLVMSVNPGYAGQSFIDVTDKVKYIREKYPNLDIEIDGGITENNIDKVAASGANVIVSGSSIFASKDMKKTIEIFKET